MAALPRVMFARDTCTTLEIAVGEGVMPPDDFADLVLTYLYQNEGPSQRGTSLMAFWEQPIEGDRWRYHVSVRNDGVAAYVSFLKARRSDIFINAFPRGYDYGDVAPVSVGVVVPCYNYGRFLEDAVRSFHAQTMPKSQRSMIIVDDGSTDDTVDVAYQAVSRGMADAVHEVFRNQGLAKSRNVGSRMLARWYNTDFLLFLDADDELAPTALSSMADRLSRMPPSVAYVYPQVQHFGLRTDLWPHWIFDRGELLRGNRVPVTAMIRRTAFEQVGGYDESFRNGHEDYELWMALLAAGYVGSPFPRPLFRYRKHGTSMIDGMSEEAKKAANAEIKRKHNVLWENP